MKKTFTTAAGIKSLPQEFQKKLEQAIANFVDTELSDLADVPGLKCACTFHTETACLSFSHPHAETKTFCVQITNAGKPLSVEGIIQELTGRKVGKTLQRNLSMPA